MLTNPTHVGVYAYDAESSGHSMPGIRLVHGVISHPEHFTPLDHAWVDLPGGIIFDGVVQAFFTSDTYISVMSAMQLDSYSSLEADELFATHHQPGPWNARWVPTPAQLQAYSVATGRLSSRPAAVPDRQIHHLAFHDAVRSPQRVEHLLSRD